MQWRRERSVEVEGDGRGDGVEDGSGDGGTESTAAAAELPTAPAPPSRSA